MGSKFDITQLQKAVQEVIPGAKSVSLLGGEGRRNSYTFKVERNNDKPIVVKVLKQKFNFEAKINDEKKSLKAIDHISDLKVSKMISSGEVSYRKMPYIAFEYYKGKEVSRLIREEGKIEEREVETFIDQMLVTIKQLALARIIHQDVKPDNIIRLDNGDYILLDLGIARFDNIDATLVKQQGPAMYLSKEQIDLGVEKHLANQRRITFLSDLNSLGITALNMLMGPDFLKLWERDRRIEASERIRQNELASISNLRLKKLIAALLEANPSTRFYALSQLTDMEEFKSKAASPLPHWSLHKSTGLTFLEEFATENPDIKLGLVVTGETVQSVSNLRAVLDKLHSNGWQTTVDPSTHKLMFPSHHGYLTMRDYYEADLSYQSFFDPQFVRRFVAKVLEFQKELGVSYYIAPYFYERKAGGEALTVTLSLYDEAKRQLQEMGDTTELVMGLSLSKDLIKDRQELSKVLDQLVMYPGCDMVYINLEMVKKSNAPCSDIEYLKGLLQIVETLTLTKRVIVSGIDQSALLVFSHSKVSVALNPNISYRKNDVDDKLSSDGPGGGPKAKDRRQRIYIPELLNDLDITRDLQDPSFVALDQSLQLGQESSKYFDAAHELPNEKARNKHFTYTFDKQMMEFIGLDRATSVKLMSKKIVNAQKIYTAIETHDIILDRDSRDAFLESWTSAHSQSQ